MKIIRSGLLSVLKTFSQKTNVCKRNVHAWIICLVWHVGSISRKHLWGRHQSLGNYPRDMLVLGGRVLTGDVAEGEKCHGESRSLGSVSWLCLHPVGTLLSRQCNSSQLPSWSYQYWPPRTGLCLILYFQPSSFSPFYPLKFIGLAQWYILQSPT